MNQHMRDSRPSQQQNTQIRPLGMGGQRPGGPGGGPGGGPPGMRMTEKARDFKGTMKELLKYLRPFRVSIIIVMVLAAISTIFNIFGPKILGKATTKLFEGVMGMITGKGTGIDFTYIGNILLIMAGLYLLSAVFSYIQGWVMAIVTARITYQFRKEISEKINRLPLKYFDGVSHGEVLSRITNDVDTISQTMNQSLTQIISSGVTLIGVLIMMLSINVVMTLISLVVIPLSVVTTMFIVRRSQHFFKQQQDYLGHVNGHIEEMYSGHQVMKAFNGEEKSVTKFNTYNDVLYHSAWMSQFLSSLMHPVINFLGNVSYVVVSILGGWLAIRGAITVGDIQAFIQYVRSFNQPVTQLATISNVLQQTAAAAERVFAFLNEAEEIPETSNPIQPASVKGEVEFSHVHFGYTPDKVIINDFSARVYPGQRIAIVGPTGAGKTTMVKLLMRFYDVNSGAILIDGHNIQDFTRNDLRKIFGMVLQDTWLFNGTIMENIRYGRPEATDQEVIAAAKSAHVDHFIHTLPGGYEMVLNEEASNVSQGQKQLLTIARAILADPHILILDEATSSVDTRTEILIQRAMATLMQGRTSFVIAHRLSTIRDADLILVMCDGDIVEQGNHEELLAKHGFYAELYNSQFETAIIGATVEV